MVDNYTQTIVDKLDIVEVIGEHLELFKKGKNYLAICPFHEDHNPSLSISNSKKIFKCFVCNKGGNVISFVAEYEKISFNKAILKLANKLGLDIKDDFISKPRYSDQEKQVINTLNEAKNFFQYHLTSELGTKAHQYLIARGITNEDMERYKIGYAPNEGLIKFLLAKGFDKANLINASLVNEYERDFFKNRIMFAILNEFGDTISFSGRIIDGKGPKYINSAESNIFKKSKLFYNINNALDHINKTKEVYVTEGFMDVIAMNKIKITNSVAIMGTALTDHHVTFLRNKQVNLMLDFDKAGIAATFKSIILLIKNNIKVKVIYSKNAKDADEILKHEGQNKLKEVVNNKINVYHFVYAFLEKQHNLKDPDGIKVFLQKFGSYLKHGDELEKDFYINKLVSAFNLTKNVVLSYIPNVVKQSYNERSDIKKDELPIKKKSINYSYVLIKSLAKNSKLLKYFKFDEVHFFDNVVIKIAKYLVSGKKDKMKEEQLKKDWIKIDEQIEDSAIINSKEELENVIEYINIDFKKKTLISTRKKIKDSKTEEEEKAHLDSFQKFQRKKVGK